MLRLSGALALFLLVGCDAGGATNQADQITWVESDDAEMNAAKAQARAALPQFYSRLADPAADERDFMVKFDIVPGEDAEFVWARDLDRSASPMTGILVNQPEYTDHQAGQRVSIPEADIIDWSYMKGGTMHGDFTDRVLIDRLPGEEAAHERALRGW